MEKKIDVQNFVSYNMFDRRGDHEKKSNIDIAVKGGNVAGFSTSIDDGTSTLLEYDVVDMGSNIRKELNESIAKEGMVVYEII